MTSHSRAALLIGTMLLATVVSTVAADPPRPGTEGNGLTENESATLWSRDNDSGYISNAAYREAYGERRSAVHQVANATDLTFTRPPATAAIWTRNDHADYAYGDRDTSVYPETADPADSTFIKDAHATVFRAQPSTWVHRTPDARTLYVAPNGRVFGGVDYRVEPPGNVSRANRSVTWTVQSHAITAVRLIRDDTVIVRADGSHRPVLEYTLAGGPATITLEADIEATLRKTTVVTRVVPRRSNATNGTTRRTPESPGSMTGTGPGDTPGNTTNRTMTFRNVTVVTDSITVRDRLDATVYDLEAWLSSARYPDGTTGIAAFQTAPWRGLSLAGDRQIRGVWRFYTARDTGWDTMTVATPEGTERRDSAALPVAVHAYPSELGPLAIPPGDGPALAQVWGRPYASPQGTLGRHVHVEVVEQEYRASYGIAARTKAPPEAVTVRGVVRGVNATITAPPGDQIRAINRSTLTLTVVEQRSDGAILRVRLRDATTGEPIVLADPAARYSSLTGDPRGGYVSVDGRRVRTNASGIATVTVADPGVYTARYEPASWLTVDPAYVGDSATARWHPLTTPAGWLRLGVRTLQWLVPFGLALYASLRLGHILSPTEGNP